MNTTLYVQRLGYTGALAPNAFTLGDLHQAHVLAVPFEALDVHLGIPITLALDALYRKIVAGRRGGFCYELNALFCHFLQRIGYRATTIAARICTPSGLGPAYDHMAVCVQLDTHWLLDVGFGDLFRRPLEIIPEVIQFDGFQYFRIQQLAPETFRLWMSPDATTFEEKYEFHTAAVPLDRFHVQCALKQTSASSYFVRNVVCTKPTLQGRKTLFNHTLTVREGEQKRVVVLTSPSELVHALAHEFEVDIAPYQGQFSAKIRYLSIEE
ncbi:arylamine N-acetyltransferase family protein [Hymenobacter crusticola]|uniref:Acetyltransferase n=1 Tax=Hymenobacter crusticola TaxID=1770526 RepID=A0A243W5P0_9BACT|nr:arylamine N-acetyltransferase [Hymenobacter crusticola]OUJ68690.1 hypothetical protein BXP70_27580 [Hymenobacter crusticola]